MSDVTVDLVTPCGTRLASSIIPKDYTVRKIIAELVDHLELPWHVNGQKVEYTLGWANQPSSLPEDATLPQAGVANGQTLRLFSPYQNVSAVPSLNQNVSDPMTGQTVEVVLTLMDLGVDFRETLRTDVQVHDLIQSLINKYLPSEKGFDKQSVGYGLRSKWHGRSLSNNKTLAQEGVASRDRLFVYRHDQGC